MKEINEEVYYPDEEIVKVSSKDIDHLKKLAQENQRRRVRLCAHKDAEDKVHEMLIVHTKDTYVRPHKHFNKSEAFHVIEGAALVVVFEENGNIKETIKLGQYGSNDQFYFRMSKAFYHTLIITSDVIVFHEVTGGPFNKADTAFAPWSPEENNTAEVEAFMDNLRKSMKDKGIGLF